MSAIDDNGRFHCGSCGRFTKESDLRSNNIDTPTMHIDGVPICVRCMGEDEKGTCQEQVAP